MRNVRIPDYILASRKQSFRVNLGETELEVFNALSKEEIEALIAGGGGGPATTDDLPEGAVNLYFTDERAQDAVAAALIDTDTIQWQYDDLGNQILARYRPAHITVSANYAITLSDDHVYVDATSGNIAITLPAVANAKKEITIKKIDSTLNTVTISGDATIDRDASLIILFENTSETLYSDGTNWYRH